MKAREREAQGETWQPVFFHHVTGNGGQPEPRLGDFRDGVVMTRFFSHLSLTAGDAGTLEPFAEELPEPIASEPGEA